MTVNFAQCLAHKKYFYTVTILDGAQNIKSTDNEIN